MHGTATNQFTTPSCLNQFWVAADSVASVIVRRVIAVSWFQPVYEATIQSKLRFEVTSPTPSPWAATSIACVPWAEHYQTDATSLFKLQAFRFSCWFSFAFQREVYGGLRPFPSSPCEFSEVLMVMIYATGPISGGCR